MEYRDATDFEMATVILLAAFTVAQRVSTIT